MCWKMSRTEREEGREAASGWDDVVLVVMFEPSHQMPRPSCLVPTPDQQATRQAVSVLPS